MDPANQKSVEYLVVDTTAFIQNAQLQNVAQKIITCPEVVSEITNKRQLRRLVVLPYDLEVKEPFPENVKLVTEFSKKTGDYRSLSATDIKVIALTYQLEKEKVGVEHIRTEPVMSKVISTENKAPDFNPDVTGFYLPSQTNKISCESPDEDSCEDQVNDESSVDTSNNEVTIPLKDDTSNNVEIKKTCDDKTNIELNEEICDNKQNTGLEESNSSDGEWGNQDENNHEHVDILVSVQEEHSVDSDSEDSDDEGWITPSNIEIAKKQVNSQLLEEKHVAVACITTDFAMQNVLMQMNLKVSALDGRIIRQLRTYILRCYACFKTTSIMTKRFCPKCGNDTLKKVGVSLDENGQMKIHINTRRPLTGRGKKYSLPRIKGGKHPNNPILVEDQPMPDNKPSRMARTKNNPLNDEWVTGFSPFVTRDVTSRSAQLGIRPGAEFKYWMKRNPNEARRRRK